MRSVIDRVFLDHPGSVNESYGEHFLFAAGFGLTLMGAYTPSRMDYTPGNNYSVALNGEDDAEIRGYWAKISAGGSVSSPLEKAPWGDSFGMCIDKFGVSWLVNIYASKPSA